jgi:hypothetical protein
MNHDPFVYTEDTRVTYGHKPDVKESDADAIIETPRHDHQWCHERVAIGSGVFDADDVAAVVRAGITHVLDCRTDPHAYKPLYRGTGVVHVACATEDDGRAKGPAWFREGVRVALLALREPETKLLVHCYAGINRGPSLAYAILRALGLDATEAERAIRSVRPLVGLRYMGDAERAVGA